ncbi:zinc-binding dehydrogenase, partial [Chlamydiales bacterium]|nr:zinc-binding dehydrogenase [Chlamydiales bacterium]
GSLQLVEKEIPELNPGEVLIKVEAAPCNPSDLLFLQGSYQTKKTVPTTPGWEGAGKVVKSGGGLLAQFLVGKRVAFTSQEFRGGTWAEYSIANVDYCFPLNETIPSEQAACLIVNPLSAVGLMRSAKGGIVQTAAVSQLGLMIIDLCHLQKIPIVNIVRREEHVEFLKNRGAEVVLNSEAQNFLEQLAEETEKARVLTGFDAVGGDLTGRVLSAMPNGSQMIVYGLLSGEPCGCISPADFLFKNKSITGFWLAEWITTLNILKKIRLLNQVKNWVSKGILHTKVRKKISLDEAKGALLEYQEEMSAGKVIISP